MRSSDSRNTRWNILRVVFASQLSLGILLALFQLSWKLEDLASTFVQASLASFRTWI